MPVGFEYFFELIFRAQQVSLIVRFFKNAIVERIDGTFRVSFPDPNGSFKVHTNIERTVVQVAAPRVIEEVVEEVLVPEGEEPELVGEEEAEEEVEEKAAEEEN